MKRLFYHRERGRGMISIPLGNGYRTLDRAFFGGPVLPMKASTVPWAWKVTLVPEWEFLGRGDCFGRAEKNDFQLQRFGPVA